MHTQSDRRSLWEATAAMAEHPALAFNVRVNVAVIGGGVAGTTSAYLLKRLGRTVALVDGHRCGLGQTGRTAGHVMAAPMLDISSLVERLGSDRTRTLWDAGGAAIARIRSIVRDERINCQFAWVPAYLHPGAADASTNMHDDLARQAALAESLGIDATFVTHVPGLGRPGLRFGGQARLHPLNYLRVLVDQVPGAGSYVFEDTHIDAIEGTGPFIVRSGDYRITADVVIAATHHRVLQAAGWEVPELRVARAYVVAGTAPGHLIDDGLYWDQDQPYGCLRVDRQDDQTLALIGGRDASAHEVSDARAIFRMLSDRLVDRVPGASPEYQWSAHTVETPDGLPCLGAVAPGQIVAMACGDNSLTFGTLGGMIAADVVLGRANPWGRLFSPDRFAAEAVSGRPDMPATAGRRPRHDRESFEALTHQDVAFAHTDGALPPGCPD